jgi:hypothetical protein
LSTTTITPSLRLKTALPIEEVRPLCQKPPSPTKEIERRVASGALKAEAEAGPRP